MGPSFLELVAETMSGEAVKEVFGIDNEEIVAAMPEEPRGCGCVLSPSIAKNVAPYSTIHNISIQKLTPEYKNGMEHLIKTKTPPMKASELWCHKPAVLLCIRRAGSHSDAVISGICRSMKQASKLWGGSASSKKLSHSLHMYNGTGVYLSPFYAPLESGR